MGNSKYLLFFCKGPDPSCIGLQIDQVMSVNVLTQSVLNLMTPCPAVINMAQSVILLGHDLERSMSLVNVKNISIRPPRSSIVKFYVDLISGFLEL